MKKKFIEFLKKNNAHETYVQNAINDHHALADQIIQRHEPKNWLKAAFDWVSTPQGQDYWDKLNKQWEKFVNPEA